MAKPKELLVKETVESLKQTIRKQSHHLRPRIQMLLLIKENKALTKLSLATALGVNHNSIQSWRKKYEQGGLSALLAYNRGGRKPSVITPQAHKAIEKRLTSKTDAFRSFEELRVWVAEHYVPGIKYTTLNEYVKRKFGAKLKVARKSHIRKDEQAVEAFKKNPVGDWKTY